MNAGSQTPGSVRGWYHGWTIVAVCILAGMAASALPINAFSLFVVPWSKDLGTPISTLTLGIAACGLLCSLISPIVGGWADRYPARLLFAAGLITTALFCFGVSIVVAPWQFIAIYALLLPPALVLSTSVPANAVVSRWFLHRRGLALGLTGFGLALGGIVMPPLLAHAIPAIGWRAVWQISGAITLLVVLPLSLLTLRDRPAVRDGARYAPADAGGPHHLPSEPVLRWRDVFGRRTFWLLVAVYIPMLGLYGGCGQNIVPLATSRGVDTTTASMFVSLYNLGQVIATLAGGVLADRLGNRVPLAALAFLTAIGGVLAAIGPDAATLAAASVLVGAGGGFWPLLAGAAAREYGASGIGRAFGALSLFIPLTSIAAISVAVGPEKLGSYAPPLLAISAIAACGGLACLLWLREKPSAVPDL